MKDRRLNSKGEIEEWERARTIPDDFIYDPETNSYYAPGEPCTVDFEERRRRTDKIIEEVRREYPIPRQRIKVPFKLVKSSSRRKLTPQKEKPEQGQRDLFSDLVDDNDVADEQESAAPDPDSDQSAE